MTKKMQKKIALPQSEVKELNSSSVLKYEEKIKSLETQVEELSKQKASYEFIAQEAAQLLLLFEEKFKPFAGKKNKVLKFFLKVSVILSHIEEFMQLISLFKSKYVRPNKEALPDTQA